LYKILATSEDQQFSKNTRKNETNTNESVQQRNRTEESFSNRFQNMMEQSYTSTLCLLFFSKYTDIIVRSRLFINLPFNYLNSERIFK
jgi:hypothetical protein